MFYHKARTLGEIWVQNEVLWIRICDIPLHRTQCSDGAVPSDNTGFWFVISKNLLLKDFYCIFSLSTFFGHLRKGVEQLCAVFWYLRFVAFLHFLTSVSAFVPSQYIFKGICVFPIYYLFLTAQSNSFSKGQENTCSMLWCLFMVLIDLHPSLP